MCSSNTITVFARMSEIRQQSITGIKWGAVQQFSSQLIHFVLGVLIARMLMPEDYGMIGMLAIFISISQAFVDSGFSQALIQKIDRNNTDCSTTFYFNIVLGFFMYIILYAAAPLIAEFYRMPLLTDIVRVYSVTIIFNSLGIVPRALRMISVDFKSLAYASIIASGISGFIGLYLAYKGYGVWALVWQSILSTLIDVLLIWIYTRWKPSLVFSWHSFRNLFSFGSKLLISGLLHRIYENISSLVIGKYYSSVDIGLYNRGRQLADLPTFNITNLLQRVTYPILVRYQNNDVELILFYKKYIRMASIIVFFMAAFLCAVAKPLIIILLTDKWIGAVPFLQIFCLAAMFYPMIGMNLTLLKIKGRTDLYLKVEVIKKAIIFPILLLAIPFGPMAICLVTVVYTQIDLFCDAYYNGKMLKYGYFAQLREGARYFIFSIIACLPAFLISMSSINSLLAIFFSIICSFGLYIIILHKDKTFLDIIRSFKFAKKRNS